MGAWVKLENATPDLIGFRVRNVGSHFIWVIDRVSPDGYLHLHLDGRAGTTGNFTPLDISNGNVEIYMSGSVSNIEREDGQPEPKPFVRKRDCFLDGHEFVDTGMTKSWCKHCDADALWDGERGRFVLVVLSSEVVGFTWTNEDFKKAYEDLSNFIVKACSK